MGTLTEKNAELMARVVDPSRITTVSGGLKLHSWMILDELMNIARADGIMMAQAAAERAALAQQGTSPTQPVAHSKEG